MNIEVRLKTENQSGELGFNEANITSKRGHDTQHITCEFLLLYMMYVQFKYALNY